MSYRIVYDIVEAGPSWWFPAAGLVPALLGPVWFLWLRHGKLPRRMGAFRWVDRRPWLFTVQAAGMFGLGVLWTAVTGFFVLSEHYDGCRILQAGAATVVAGPVERFEPQPKGGKGFERFEVGGVAFAYSKSEVAAGFRTTVEDGGPVRAGVAVRIHCAEVHGRRAILRLEVRE